MRPCLAEGPRSQPLVGSLILYECCFGTNQLPGNLCVCCCPCIPGCCEKNKEPASNIRIFCSTHFHPPKSEMPKRLKEADNRMRCSDASRMSLSDAVAHVSQILLEQQGIPDGSRGQAACPTSEEASSIKEIRGPANRSGYCTCFPPATGQ